MKPTCPYCHSTKVQRRGTFPKTRYQCVDKNHTEGSPRWFYEETSKARILVFDIETLPIIKRAWRLGEEDWNPESIIHDWCILSIAWKWLFEAQSSSEVMTPKEALARDDKRLVQKIHTLLESADIVIAHNGDSFDLPKVNTRFLYYGMGVPSPYLTIDTRATASKAFGFTSNKLDYLAEYLGLPKKKHTDYGLWIRCEAGEKEALKYMADYNEQDIRTLEDVYIMLRPWIKHPNMGLYVLAGDNKNICPHCGHDDIDWDTFYRTPARVYHAFRCHNCGAVGREFKSFVTTTTTRVVR